MAWIWAALMPHPPIIVPEVGHGREQEAAATLDGLERLLARLAVMAHTGKPDVMLVLSPHQPYAPGAFSINIAPRISGSLAPFGAPSVAFTLDTPVHEARALADHLRASRVPVTFGALEDLTKDHGSIVPLYFLARTFGGELPPVILASPIGLAPSAAHALGTALQSFRTPKPARPKTAGQTGTTESVRNSTESGSWALLASGDLSHRLKAGAPSGYRPEGAVFDKAIVRALKTGDSSLVSGLPQDVLTNAGECGMRSVLALLGLTDGPVEVFSYEGPFGVGYCNALWKADSRAEAAANPAEIQGCVELKIQKPAAARPAANPPSAPATGHPYPKLARLVVSRLLTGDRPQLTESDAAALAPEEKNWQEQKACFVSIKTKAGSLRGCIGTILPASPSLVQEIIMNAVSASTRDPRFPPMRAEELDNAVFSVDVLGAPEPVADPKELDPRVWGVIVTKGKQRGLLLPDLPGVDTVEKQISIAAQKAGISDLSGISLQRFSVQRYLE